VSYESSHICQSLISIESNDKNLNQSLLAVNQRMNGGLLQYQAFARAPFQTQPVYMTGMNQSLEEENGLNSTQAMTGADIDTLDATVHSCRIVSWTDESNSNYDYYASAPNALVAAVLPFMAYSSNLDVFMDPAWTVSRSKQPYVKITFQKDYVWPDLTSLNNYTELTFPTYYSDDTSGPSRSYAEFLQDNATLGSGGQTYAYDSPSHTALLAWLDYAQSAQGSYDIDQQQIDSMGYPMWTVTTAVVDAFWADMQTNSTSDACVGTSGQAFIDMFDDDRFVSGDGPFIHTDASWAQQIAQLARESQPQVEDLWQWSSIAPAFALGLGSVNYPFFNSSIPEWGYNTDPSVFMMSIILPGSNDTLDPTTQDISPSPDQQLWDSRIDKQLQTIRGSFSDYYALLGDGDPGTLETLDVISYRKGFGYSADSKTVRAAMAIIGLYVVITLSFLLFTFVTGETAGSWAGVSEVVMLAMNSRRPLHLGPTSVGVETTGVFKKHVEVGVNEEGSVGLIFEGEEDEQKGLLEKVRAGERY
jgi:hypothetical protein